MHRKAGFASSQQNQDIGEVKEEERVRSLLATLSHAITSMLHYEFGDVFTKVDKYSMHLTSALHYSLLLLALFTPTPQMLSCSLQVIEPKNGPPVGCFHKHQILLL